MKSTRLMIGIASVALMLSLSVRADVVIVATGGGYVSGHDLVVKMDVPMVDMRLMAAPQAADQNVPGATAKLEKAAAAVPTTCGLCPAASPLQPSENHLAYMRIGWLDSQTS
ncbi:MAG TPA: hypothetical protein VK974_00695 [Methylophilaceae bacterium]|nr:hypothetical protein [Methylophilaceae bacterium]